MNKDDFSIHVWNKEETDNLVEHTKTQRLLKKGSETGLSEGEKVGFVEGKKAENWKGLRLCLKKE